MALTMTEEQERDIRGFPDTATVAQKRALLIELDATRAELARLRAELPSDAERAALKTLRELRASPAAGGIAKWLRKRSEPVGNLRATLLMQGLAALLAPEGEESR